MNDSLLPAGSPALHSSPGDVQHQFTVYLIRHAEPAHWGGSGQRYDLPPGPPLSAAGQIQAAMAANFLLSHMPATVYTSPLARALETGQILSAHLGLPLVVDERIAEHRREEKIEEVAARVADFWQERVIASPPGCIALVSHGSPIKQMLSALGDVLTADPKRYRFDHGNIAPPAGIWRARSIGQPHQGCRWELDLIFRTVGVQQNAPPPPPHQDSSHAG